MFASAKSWMQRARRVLGVVQGVVLLALMVPALLWVFAVRVPKRCGQLWRVAKMARQKEAEEAKKPTLLKFDFTPVVCQGKVIGRVMFRSERPVRVQQEVRYHNRWVPAEIEIVEISAGAYAFLGIEVDCEEDARCLPVYDDFGDFWTPCTPEVFAEALVD